MGHTTILDVDKRITASQRGRVEIRIRATRHEIAGITHYDLVPEGATPATDYDLRRLPRYLFVGAAGMILIALVWLIRPIGRVRVEELGR